LEVKRLVDVDNGKTIDEFLRGKRQVTI